MQEKTVIKAEYRGQVREAGDLLVSLRREYQRLIRENEAERAQNRKRLARRLKAAKQRVSISARRLGMKRAESELLERLGEQEARFLEALREAKRDCVALALSIAEEVLGQAVQNDHQGLADKVAAALAPLSSGSLRKVLVHRNNCREIAEALPGLPVEAAPHIKPGNVLIKTPCGEIAIEWRDHFAQIEAMLKRQLESESEGPC